MTIDLFNQQSPELIRQQLFTCCGSSVWADKLVCMKPVNSVDELIAKSDICWNECGKTDWLEAFTHHPKIGDLESLEKKFQSTKEWASGEQSGVNSAAKPTIQELADGNKKYEDKFGFIFIVCATGKTAEEMLELLLTRLRNDPEKEILIARNEQNKITHLRLKKLFV